MRRIFPFLLALAACSSAADRDAAESTSNVSANDPHAFPTDFAFGTAIAGFQVDMGCPTIDASRCEDRHSDWYAWITSPFVKYDPLEFMSREPPTAGPGFYELYDQDIGRAHDELRNDAMRLSIEWSRVFPQPTFGVDGEALRALADPDALAYYHAQLGALRARGMKPFVTINHYTLPDWIHDAVGCNLDFDGCTKRGWADGATIVPEIAKYAGFVAEEFGGEVDDWATLNEPFTAVIIPSFIMPSPDRSNPPGVHFHVDAAKSAMIAMIEAHARMYDAVHAADQSDADGDGVNAKVGIVYNMQAVAPLTDDDADARVAGDARYFMNEMFLDGAARGDLDRNWDGNVEHRDDLAKRIDFIGINYYALLYAQAIPIQVPGLDRISPKLTFNFATPKTDFHYPAGIAEVLHEASRYGVPLVVSETGVDDGAGAYDAAWVKGTLGYVKKAMNEGVDVRGYFYWSLMDNYEWNHGTHMKFGLYAVDARDKHRTARDGVRAYGQIAGSRKVEELPQ
jgi:beta-glucosidase/6-phospho-beta-glucosidase/beta-galactosidase